MTWEQILSFGRKRLKEAGIAEADLDAWYLFEKAFGISRAQYFLCARESAEPAESSVKEFKAGLERRAKREPLQHILGTQEFMGMEFYVNRHVLIPRQDTETLVETVLAECREKNVSVLDMCTGSGCIAVSLATLGRYAQVEAADISAEALAVAEQNAIKILASDWQVEAVWQSGEAVQIAGAVSGKEPRDEKAARPDVLGRRDEPTHVLKLRQSDMFSAFASGEKFDIIVSNPPYIPSMEIERLEPEVRDFEPRAALDGTADGLFFYRKLAEEAGTFLKENGRVYFEIGYDQGEAVCGLLAAHGFYDTRVIKDLAGKDRVVCARWQAGRNLGSKDKEVTYV